jgi:hypothetical protein
MPLVDTDLEQDKEEYVSTIKPTGFKYEEKLLLIKKNMDFNTRNKKSLQRTWI